MDIENVMEFLSDKKTVQIIHGIIQNCDGGLNLDCMQGFSIRTKITYKISPFFERKNNHKNQNSHI